MTRLPRDVSATKLVKRLAQLGYQTTRQTGSHIRLYSDRRGGHRISVPRHKSLRVGTLHEILSRIAKHFEIRIDDLLEQLHL